MICFLPQQIVTTMKNENPLSNLMLPVLLAVCVKARFSEGYPNFPTNGAVGASIAPQLQDGMGSLAAHGGHNHTAVAAAVR